MKPIIPSLRENNRYITFQIQADKQFNNEEIKKMLQEEFLTFLGSLELAKSSFKLVSFNKNKGIVKVNSKYLDKLRAMLPLINKLNNEKVNIKSLKTSGLINKVKMEA